MNEPGNAPFDRILLPPPPVPPEFRPPLGPRTGPLLDEIPMGPSVLPPSRPPLSMTTPEKTPEKPAETPAAAPEPAAEKASDVVGTPAPKPRWVKDALRDLVTMNRKKSIALTAGTSVVVAALLINAVFFGGSETPEPAPDAPAPLAAVSPPEPKSAEAARAEDPPPGPAAPDRAPAVSPEPPPTSFPAIPTLPPIGDGSAAAAPARTNESTTASPPAVAAPLKLNENTTAGLPPIAAPILPTPAASNPPAPKVTELPPVVLPATHNEPAPPASPPAGLPVPPPALPVGSPPAAEAGKDDAKKDPVVAIPPAVTLPDPTKSTTPLVAPPVLPPPGTGTTGSGTTTTAAGTGSSGTTPVVPTPPSPFNTGGTDSGAGAPSAPLIPPPAGPAEPPGPKVDPPVVGATPPAPLKLDPPTGPTPAPAAGTLTLDKVPGASGVRPTEPPRTDFDIDLHEPRAGETYESISKLHYGDGRYAEALRAFNRNLELGRGGSVEVPPLYVLRKRYPPAAAPVRSGEPAIRGVDWTAAPGRGVEPATYDVTRDGTTLWDVAEETLGDRRQWKRIADANPGLDPNGLTRGTKVKLPPDAKLRR